MTQKIPRYIYSDGSCLAPDHHGGWGFVAWDEHRQLLFESGGFAPVTTNNRMELLGILNGLAMALADLKQGYGKVERLSVISDSQYCVNSFNDWRHGWKKRGWKKSDGTDIKNPDLIAYGDSLIEELEAMGQPVAFRWTRGHSGNPGNERADAIASAFCHAQDSAQAIADGGLQQFREPLPLELPRVGPVPQRRHRHRIFQGEINGVGWIETTSPIFRKVGICLFPEKPVGTTYKLFREQIPGAAWDNLSRLAGES